MQIDFKAQKSHQKCVPVIYSSQEESLYKKWILLNQFNQMLDLINRN